MAPATTFSYARQFMPILRLENVSLAYGHVPLLASVDFQIDAGERVCLVGRNGAGKTSLLRVISQSATADAGEIWRPDTLRVAHLEQEVPPDTEQTVFDVVAGGLGELGGLLSAYHQTSRTAETDLGLHRLAELHSRIDDANGWNVQQKVEAILSRLSLPADVGVSECSGGTRRQVLLARALVSEPDLLLLDEPTNHLDVNTITWLE